MRNRNIISNRCNVSKGLEEIIGYGKHTFDVSQRLTVNHVPSFGIVHLFCLNIIWNCSPAMNTCMVLADSQELMEDVPHPCIFKDKCSHFERGWRHGR